MPAWERVSIEAKPVPLPSRARRLPGRASLTVRMACTAVRGLVMTKLEHRRPEEHYLPLLADHSSRALLRHWPASAWRQNHLANVAPFGEEAMGVTGPAEWEDLGN